MGKRDATGKRKKWKKHPELQTEEYKAAEPKRKERKFNQNNKRKARIAERNGEVYEAPTFVWKGPSNKEPYLQPEHSRDLRIYDDNWGSHMHAEVTPDAVGSLLANSRPDSDSIPDQETITQETSTTFETNSQGTNANSQGTNATAIPPDTVAIATRTTDTAATTADAATTTTTVADSRCGGGAPPDSPAATPSSCRRPGEDAHL